LLLDDVVGARGGGRRLASRTLVQRGARAPAAARRGVITLLASADEVIE
jgi:hypothetical protein